MISVTEALEHAFALAPKLPSETVRLEEAAGRVLVEPATAERDQPPFPASAMDGYAVPNAEVKPGARFRVIGESSAGARFGGTVGSGQAVRIFTGAPVPPGADRVVIQEDVSRESDTITLRETLDKSSYIRPAGTDFRAGASVEAPRRLGPSDLGLLAAMNVPAVQVSRRPVVAIIASGDELVWPGETPGPDQIISSNTYALAAIAALEGAQTRVLPIARDTTASIRSCFALDKGADLIVTSGGASVGDYDMMFPVAAELGMRQSFYKVAMRPGKPLMAGKLRDAMVLGLPGNPVSSIVCGHVFMRPILRAMQGLPARALSRNRAELTHDLDANGPREHYMRAQLHDDGRISVANRQDSSLLSVVANANALVVRQPNDPMRAAGDLVDFISI